MSNGTKKPVRKKHQAKVMEVTAVGMLHRVTPGTLGEIADSCPLHCRLEREPMNSNDENAIKVFITDRPWSKQHGDMQIGYVARATASVIAPVMDADEWEYDKCMMVSVDEDTGSGELRLRQ
jgi:hypothetical protein